MKITEHIKTIVTEAICFLYIILFVYAAVNKILDFENFQVQLGQSPLLSAFAGPVSYMVPCIEIIISGILIFPRFRAVGLLAAFSLMIMFTTYIIIILHFSPFVPCSCGGILEKLTWNQHLLFNVVFVLIGFVGIMLSRKTSSNLTGIFKQINIAAILLTAICSIGAIGILFLLSEDMIHHRNNFVRRFPHHPALLKNEVDLKQYSFYISGVDKGSIYVANSIAPLAMTVFDTSLQKQKSYRIQLPKNDFQFRTVRVAVVPPYFYVSDGTVPVIFRGNISDWKASVWMHGDAYFTHMQPINPKVVAIRAISSKNQENVLGIINITKQPSVLINDKLLKKQIDGDFDTDGVLLYNYQLNKIVYTYFYRNQFIVTDSIFATNFTGNTIDTTSRAKIKVTYVKSRNERKLSSPPLIVNKFTATFGQYLFVNAGLMGKYEPAEMWSEASIIDVYDMEKRIYGFSFYINDIYDEKLTDFRINNDLFVGIIGRSIVTYRLKSSYYSNY